MTGDGVVVLTFEPLPSWPTSLLPQQRREPSLWRIAQTVGSGAGDGRDSESLADRVELGEACRPRVEGTRPAICGAT